MNKIERWSFVLFFSFLLGVAYFQLVTPLITVLFSCFALQHLRLCGKKSWAVVLFFILVTLIFYFFGFFLNEARTTLPRIIDTSLPLAIDYAKSYGINLPFSDLESLKALGVEGVKDQLGEVAKFAKLATKEFLFLIIGLVVSISIFLNSRLDLDQGNYTISNNLYSLICQALSRRFSSFFESFQTVMGAQLIISAINTFSTAIFVLIIQLPYGMIVIVLTFLCGLLPIVGNLISNAIIFCIALTSSFKVAVGALVFLIVLHKVEYFLNSKIIGGRIKNPMWLTLVGLIVGERVMGIPGMILAPVILHYLKHEGSKIEINLSQSS